MMMVLRSRRFVVVVVVLLLLVAVVAVVVSVADCRCGCCRLTWSDLQSNALTVLSFTAMNR